MKAQGDNEDILRAILKEDGLEVPDEQFSERLKHLLVERYRKPELNGLEKNQWPARIILFMAIIWSGVLLYYVNAFVVTPVGFTLVAFLLGLWAVIMLVRKHQHVV